MPQDAVVRDEVVQGVPIQSAVSQTHGHEFVFVCVDFSNAPEKVPEAQLANGMLDGMVKSSGGELVRVKGSDASLDFVLKMESGYQRGRVQVRNQWGYTTMVGPVQGLASKDIRKFMASVAVGVPTSAQP